MNRHFKSSDVRPHSVVQGAGKLNTEAADLVFLPLKWQSAGLQQTTTGYGKKLVSQYVIAFEGRIRRIYITCFSNVQSDWFTYKGRTIFIG